MTPLPRRDFLTRAAALAALPAFLQSAPQNPTKSAGIVDCNVHLGEHLNRELLPVTAQLLADKGIDEAWAAPVEALLHRDMAAVNARHAARCSQAGSLIAVGAVHPGLPDWEDDLRRCSEVHGMNIIRLYPGYHGYALDDARFLKLLELATEKQVRVQIVAKMEDERTQHPLMMVKPVDFKPLGEALKQVPGASVMVLNASATMVQTSLRGLPVHLDMAMIEGVGGVENLLKTWPAERVVFGSHAPFFYPESSLLKMQESELTAAQKSAVEAENAVRWRG